ncbi:MAG: VCBS repeat-containing protein, partial [Herpetosiphonaceae bacterium]|nr:VCBS repeat-containing protein [Herpetosiphonaceae bacterium]
MYKLEIVLYGRCGTTDTNPAFVSKINVNNQTVDVLPGTSTAFANGSVMISHYFEYGPVHVLPSDQNKNPEQCPCRGSQSNVGKPINTRTGNLWTDSADIAVPLIGTGPDIAWSATYNSQSITETLASFGAGWQHPYATRLVLPTMPSGEPNTAIIVSPTGNRYRFQNLGNGTFKTYPGIYSTLAQVGATYVQTMSDQEQRTFDSTGRLISMRTKDGRMLALDYTNGLLTNIRDQANAQRFLAITYNGAQQIQTVQDPFGRSLQYAYANGDITQITDVAGRATTYIYQSHLLTRVNNALGQPIERTAYDVYTPAGKAISQTLQDGRRLNLSYLPGSTVVTTTARDGVQDVETFFYNAGNTLIRHSQNGAILEQSSYNNAAFAPGLQVDGNGNPRRTTFTSFGQPTKITNAVNDTTLVRYDALSRPISITDSLGRTSLFTYDPANNNVVREIVGITTDTPLGLTSLYTYSVTFPDRLMAESSSQGIVKVYDYDAAGHRTLDKTLFAGQTTEQTIMTYNAQGLLASHSIAYGSEPARLTTYAYDGRGRLTGTTVDAGTPQQRYDVTVYNADDTVKETIQNYRGTGIYDPAKPTENIITGYGYDALGRQLWERDAAGTYSMVHYNQYGERDWEVINLYPVALYNGQVVIPATPPAYDPAFPYRNVATFYAYDSLGRATTQTAVGFITGPSNPQTYTRVVQTGYDSLSRAVATTTTLLLAGQVVNLKADLTRYDAANNVVGQRDSYGRWTCTTYDDLNRPTTVIQNCEDGEPTTLDPANATWATLADTDIVTVNEYGPGSQLLLRTDNYIDGIFNNEPNAVSLIDDRFTTYHYTPLGMLDEVTTNADPNSVGTRTDTNSIQRTRYDGYQRPYASADPLGRWVNQQYDAFGRVIKTTLNCRNAQGPTPTGCAAFTATRTDRNVTSQTLYDAAGRATDATDVYGRVQKTRYNLQGQPTAQIDNYVVGGPSNAETNVTTLTSYDVFGRAVRITDTLGLVTQYTYNVLGQVKTKVDATSTTTYTYNALGYLTQEQDSVRGTSTVTYDGRGQQQSLTRGDGMVTRVNTTINLAVLGDRVVSTTRNYRQDDPSSDSNIGSFVSYDAAGRVWQDGDAAVHRTIYLYDLLDHVIAVYENYTFDCVASPSNDCNVLTRYEYDRMGNQTAIVDARTNRRTFKYDALGRQTHAIDALNQTTQQEYDTLGRVTRVIDPRGPSYNVQHQYDELDRITETLSLKLDAPIQSQYDALGLRTTLIDESGTTTFSYDPLLRMKNATQPVLGTVGYGYNARGDRTQLTYPDGTAITYTYQPDGQLDQVKEQTTTLVDYGYHPITGQVQSAAYANGATTQYGYDRVDRLKAKTTTTAGILQSSFTYGLNKLGQRTAVTETLALPAPTLTLNYNNTFANIGNNPTRVTSGDVNRDGSPDVAVARSTGIRILKGTPTVFPYFQVVGSEYLVANASAVQLGDLDGDDKLDLVASSTSGNTIAVFKGNGDGTFQTPATTYATGTAPADLILADLNRDGKLDALVSNGSANTLGLLVGNGNATFQAQQTIAVGTGPRRLAVGDVNGDGRLDVAVPNYTSSSVSLVTLNASNQLSVLATITTPANPSATAIADLNRDGKADLVVTHGTSAGEVSTYFGNNNGTFAARRGYPVGVDPVGVSVDDLNLDGAPDIIVVNRTSANVHVLANTGTGLFGTVAIHAITGGTNASDVLPLAIKTSVSNASRTLLT